MLTLADGGHRGTRLEQPSCRQAVIAVSARRSRSYLAAPCCHTSVNRWLNVSDSRPT
jgi:hypothetical protein